MPGWLRLQLTSCHGWRLSAFRLGKSIGAVFNELQNAPGISLDQGPMQRSKALLIGGVDARAPAQKDIYT